MLAINADENDRWDEIPNNIKDEINEAIKDLDEGKGISEDEVKRMYPQWFTK